MRKCYLIALFGIMVAGIIHAAATDLPQGHAAQEMILITIEGKQYLFPKSALIPVADLAQAPQTRIDDKNIKKTKKKQPRRHDNENEEDDAPLPKRSKKGFPLLLYLEESNETRAETRPYGLLKAGDADGRTAYAYGFYYFQKNDYDKAEEMLKKSMVYEGDARSFYLMARIYENGLGRERDLEKAHDLYDASARAGCPDAQLTVGYFHEYENCGFEGDINEARFWYEAAAKNKHPDALCNLGMFYERGIGVDIDINRAIEYYKTGADLGSALAKYHLGLLYFSGLGFPLSDLKKAMELLLAAKEDDIPEAYIDLGVCYDRLGKHREAFQLYLEAITKFEVDQAFFKVAACYENGRGIKQDIEKAISFYKIAAEKYDLQEAKEALQKLRL